LIWCDGYAKLLETMARVSTLATSRDRSLALEKGRCFGLGLAFLKCLELELWAFKIVQVPGQCKDLPGASRFWAAINEPVPQLSEHTVAMH
jgi:hypothetical protein